MDRGNGIFEAVVFLGWQNQLRVALWKVDVIEEMISLKKRFCAHRGVSALMPENTLPAFAAAIALGTDEIEFDVRLTKDEQMIVSHDGTLEQILNGVGYLQDLTLLELKRINVGQKYGWNVPFCTPEEVFDRFCNQVVFNIHLKEHGENGLLIKKMEKLIKEYDAYQSVYFAASPSELDWIQRIAPNVKRAAIQLPHDNMGVFEMAERYGCSRVQFWNGMFDTKLIDRLHDCGVICNLFYADSSEDYDKYFEMGIDTLLTNRMDLTSEYKKTSRWF